MSLPTHIGPYRVARLIAQGGVAAVYEVADAETGRSYAAKLLQAVDAGGPRFSREYRSLARIDHPGIVRVFRYGETPEGRPYLLMELLDGVPAQVRVKAVGRAGDTARTIEACRIAVATAEALQYLHDRQIVHRDVKSSNVMVLRDGTVKLLDFGTALVRRSRDHVTRQGEFVGTFAYASPEQITGQALDGRADLYSLGVLLFRMLTAKRPFDAEDPHTLARMHLKDPPPAPRTLVPSLSPVLEELVLHLLAKRPEQRPASAAAVAQRLRPFVAGTPPAHAANMRVSGRALQVRAGGEFVAALRPGTMLLFRGAPGSGRGRLVDAAADEAAQRGMRVVQYDAGEGGLRGVAAQLVGFSGELDPPGLEQSARAALRDPGPELLGAAIAARARVEPAGVLVAARAFHRCTPSQRAVLADVMRVSRDRGAPAILVATIGERAPLPADGAEVVEVPPLSPAETATLASESLGVSQVPPELVRKLHRLSGGLPVLVEAMLRGLPAGRATGVLAIPAELSAAAALRVAGLERIERRVAEVVAMAPGDTDARATAVAIDEDPAAVVAAVEGLVADGVLARHGAGWAFRVGLCAEAVRAATRAARRAVLVKRVADQASELLPSRSLAELLLEAGRPEDALRVGMAWAGSMAALGLHAEVTELLERLLRASGAARGHAALALMYAECLVETAPRGAEVDAAIEAAQEAATTPEARGEVALVAASLARARGDLSTERSTLGEAVGSIPSAPRAAAVRDRLAEAAMAMGDLADALEFATAASRDLPGARTRATLAAALAERGDIRAAEAEARAALAGATGGGSSAWRARAALAKALRAEGRLSEAHAALEGCLGAARSEAPAQRLAAVLLAMAEVDIDLFRVGLARERVQQALDALHGEVPARLEAQHAILQARLLAEAESYPLALMAIDAGLERASTRGQRAAAAFMRGVRGALVAFSGGGTGQADFEAARVELAEMGAFPAFATVAALQARVSGGSADPEALFAPLQGWMAIEPARVARLEYHLARVRRARRLGEPLSGPLTDAQHLFLEIRGWLAPPDAAALAVHPWARVLGM